MALKQRIIKGQGPLFFGDYDANTGRIKNEVRVGCATRVLTLSPSRETDTIKESCTGQALDLAEYETSKSLNISLEMQQFDEAMLAFALYGAATDITGAAVVDEVMPAMVVDGYYHTKHAAISAVSIEDSAGVPATLTLGTHYIIDDANYGRIKILNLAAFTQPLTVSYTHASRINVKPFSETGVVKGLIFDGISSVDSSRMRVLLPRISFSPTSEFGLVSDNPVSLTLEGKALLADVNSADPILGPFGNIELLA